MNKNFIKFFTIYLSVLTININICYSMEDVSKAETNTNNINEQDINNNLINEHPQQNNNQIRNNNYNSAELIKTTENILDGCDSVEYYGRESITKKIMNYLDNIRAFYNSNDTNILQQLTNIVHSTINNNYDELVKTSVVSTLKYWMEKNVIKAYECEDVLIFHLFLNIMTNIEHAGERAWSIKDIERNSLCTIPITIDGEKWWIPESHINGLPYKFLLADDTKYLIMKLTGLLIPKYFVLDKPETWITKDELTSEIKDYIKSMCKYFDSLPLVKQILNSKNIKSTYDSIPAVNMELYISDTINSYFSKLEVKTKFKEEANKYFKKVQQAQISRAHKESKWKDVKNQYILQEIGSYVGSSNYKKQGTAESFHDIIKYRSVPDHSDFGPGTIPYIVKSYLHPELKIYDN